MNILTDEERSDLAREMVKGMRSVDWLCEKLESAVLSKLAEQDVEPVAYLVSLDKAPIASWLSEEPADAEGVSCRKLYTESQLLAAQQRTAEACAEVCSLEAWAADAMDSIRNGDWREYL